MKFLWKAWFPEAPEEGYQVVEAATGAEASGIARGDDCDTDVQVAPLSAVDLDRECREAKLEALDDMKSQIAALEHSAKEMA